MNTVALGLDRTRLELKQYAREKEAVFFNFLFPILMLMLFSVIFSGQFDDATSKRYDVSAAQYFLPGMVSAGVLLTSFQTMALAVAVERDDGTLKRIRSTPLPAIAYFLGKIGLVVATSIAQFVVLLLVARLGFGVRLPSDPARWVTFGWVFLLGIVAGVTLGIAYSSVGSARSISAVVIAPALVLQFISGVYFPFREIPGWLQHIAAIFPLKWIAQGMRSVFLPDAYMHQEMAGSWEHGRIALVLAA